MTPIEPLLALSEKATPGPFTAEDADGDGSVYFICVQHPEVGTVSVAETRAGCDEASEMGGNPEANALFLVAAANYVRANVKALASTASELPGLPEPAMREVNPYFGTGADPYGTQNLVWYSADQVRTYGQACAESLANARGDGWTSVEDRLPDEETMVLVYTPDTGDGERISFDWVFEGVWYEHAESYEHYMMIGGANACGPDVVCTGPSQDAPYTHWMYKPAPPAPGSEAGPLVDPSMEPFCVDDLRATADKGDRDNE